MNCVVCGGLRSIMNEGGIIKCNDCHSIIAELEFKDVANENESISKELNLFLLNLFSKAYNELEEK